MTDYNASSIQTLDFVTAVRLRIAMYMGSADNQGVLQCIREIITNSIDEYTMGYGNEIKVELHPNNKITISDNARGAPFGIREDGTEALEAIYLSAHSGGKFSEKTYQNVSGQNGIGGKGVALSAKWFMAQSYRQEGIATLIVEKGVKKSFKIEENKSSRTGTVVSFIPDEEVYNLEPINIDYEEVKLMCKNWSFLSKNLKFILVNHITGQKDLFLSKNGLLDLLKDNVKNPIHSTPIYYELKNGNIEVEIAAQWTKDKEVVYTFTNGLQHTEGGTSLTGLRTAITRNMKKILRLDLPSEMLRTGLIYTIACKIPNPSFSSQVKNKINNPELRSLADKAFTEAITIYKNKYPADIQAIGEFFAKEKKADEAAHRAREAVLNHVKIQTEASRKKVLLAGKLKDCREHGQDSTLVIVEGDSALGSLQAARNIDRTALQPIRGKIINALRNPMEEVLENAEVNDIILSLGCGINGQYNPKKLRYGSVAMAVDGDADGYNIMCLITVLFYKLIPKFIEEGRLKWLRAPLYKVKYTKQTLFAYNDEELKGIQKKHGAGTVTRIKGLGELDAEDIRSSMFNAKEQRLEVLTYFNRDDAITQLEMLMGSDVPSRREFIMDNIDFELLED